MPDFAGAATPLGSDDIDQVAAELGLEPAMVHAVKDIESAGRGFLPDNRPVILFESHAFSVNTGGIYDADYPEISTPSWVRNYGPGGAHQYDRLEAAVALDRTAALKSASWGAFQIMGSNFAVCGFANVEAFVAAMMASERAQLAAFGAFCRKTGALDRLRNQDWAGFARIYNGPGYAANGYDWKLAAAYRKWRSIPAAQPGNAAPRTIPAEFHTTLHRGSTGPEVAKMQAFLQVQPVDGNFGPITEAAVERVQRANGLTVDGWVGPQTRPFVGLT